MTKCDYCGGKWVSEEEDVTIGEFTRNVVSDRLKSLDKIWIRLGYSGKHICFECLFKVEQIDNKIKMRKEFAIMLDRCGCSRASLSFTAREAIHATLETGTKIEKIVPSCTPSRCFPTLYHFLYPNGGFTGVSDMCKRSLKKHVIVNNV
jgi:hypothetical protein